MNHFKKIFFILVAFAGQAVSCHRYNETANQEALDAIHEYQSKNSAHSSSRLESYYWNDPNGPWRKVLNYMVFRVREAVLNGANPNLIVYEKTTLFSFMISCCDLELFDILVKSGADVNARSSFGWTSLMSLSSSISRREIAKALIRTPGIDLNVQDDSGQTALMHACFWGNHELVKALLDAGANKSLVDHSGYTARAWADKSYNQEDRQMCIHDLESSSWQEMPPFIFLTALGTSAITMASKLL